MRNDVVTFVVGALCVLLGAIIGAAITLNNVNAEVLRQCKAGEFYFFDGVGIHCPTVQDNRKEQK